MFVARSAPGDLAEVALDPSGATWRGRLLRVIEPGAGRVVPACRFFEACGGCDWMHLSAEAQRDAHRAIVREALSRIAGASSLPEIVTHEVPQRDKDAASPLAYRARARLHAKAHRGRIAIGYHAEGSHDLAPIDECLVLVPELAELLTELPRVLVGAKGSGEIAIACGVRGLPVVDMTWRGSLPAALWARLDERVTTGRWAGARVLIEGASAPASFGDPRPVSVGADGLPLVHAAGGFAQPSGEAAQVLARQAAALVKPESGSIGILVELFAGSGTLSIALAPLAEKFIAVESFAESARAARENLAARGLSGKVVVSRSEAYDLGRASIVVLDPPRTGARETMRSIAASRARAVVYVACDPVTLARDAAVLLAAGFAITAVETIEMFPQTSHIETLVRFEKAERR